MNPLLFNLLLGMSGGNAPDSGDPPPDPPMSITAWDLHDARQAFIGYGLTWPQSGTVVAPVAGLNVVSVVRTGPNTADITFNGVVTAVDPSGTDVYGLRVKAVDNTVAPIDSATQHGTNGISVGFDTDSDIILRPWLVQEQPSWVSQTLTVPQNGSVT